MAGGNMELAATRPVRVHGGADANAHVRWDFSTCANAAGPCPEALAAVRAADPTRYPDPAGTAVREALSGLHGVAPWRVLLAASASEFIQRVTAVGNVLAPGPVQVPRHAYGDYAHAARAWSREIVQAGMKGSCAATLIWQAEPSSPFGHDDPPAAHAGAGVTVLDAVYAPLRLHGAATWTPASRDAVFVLHSPNKALGLTGLRGAYVIAPKAANFDVQAWCDALERAAPSWPLSAQADALLRSWATPSVQRWVIDSLPALAVWRAQLQQRLATFGFVIEPSIAPFFVARPHTPLSPQDIHILRAHGVAVRDLASFGLPGQLRVSAQPPVAQDALLGALAHCLIQPGAHP